MPEPPLRTAFDRARAAAAAVRAHRIAALTPDEKQHYAALEREVRDQQQQRDETREATREQRVETEYLRQRTRPGAPDLTPRGEVQSTEAAARKRAEEVIRRQDINDRNAEVRASRSKLDDYLANSERARNERDRER